MGRNETPTIAPSSLFRSSSTSSSAPFPPPGTSCEPLDRTSGALGMMQSQRRSSSSLSSLSSFAHGNDDVVIGVRGEHEDDDDDDGSDTASERSATPIFSSPRLWRQSPATASDSPRGDSKMDTDTPTAKRSTSMQVGAARKSNRLSSALESAASSGSLSLAGSTGLIIGDIQYHANSADGTTREEGPPLPAYAIDVPGDHLLTQDWMARVDANFAQQTNDGYSYTFDPVSSVYATTPPTFAPLHLPTWPSMPNTAVASPNELQSSRLNDVQSFDPFTFSPLDLSLNLEQRPEAETQQRRPARPISRACQSQIGMAWPVTSSQVTGGLPSAGQQVYLQYPPGATPSSSARTMDTAKPATGIEAALGSFAVSNTSGAQQNMIRPYLLSSSHVHAGSPASGGPWIPQGSMPPPPSSASSSAGSAVVGAVHQVPMWMYDRAAQMVPTLSSDGRQATSQAGLDLHSNPLQTARVASSTILAHRPATQAATMRMTPTLAMLDDTDWAQLRQEWIDEGASREQIEFVEKLHRRRNASSAAEGSWRHPSATTDGRFVSSPMQTMPPPGLDLAQRQNSVQRFAEEHEQLPQQQRQTTGPVWTVKDVAPSMRAPETPRTRTKRIRREKAQQQRALGKHRRPTARKKPNMKLLSSEAPQSATSTNNEQDYAGSSPRVDPKENAASHAQHALPSARSLPPEAGIVRLLQYAAAVRVAEKINSMGHWQALVEEFFSSEAIGKFELISKTGDERRSYELAFSSLAHFFDSSRRSGIVATTLSVLNPIASHIRGPVAGSPPTGITVCSDDASWHSLHASGWLAAAKGSIRAGFRLDTASGKLKMNAIVQQVNSHAEYVDTAVALASVPSSNAEDAASAAPTQLSNALAFQPLPTPPNSMHGAHGPAQGPGEQAASNTQVTPKSPFDTFGITAVTMRFFEITETLQKMEDLFRICETEHIRPKDALHAWTARHLAQQSPEERIRCVRILQTAPAETGLLPDVSSPADIQMDASSTTGSHVATSPLKRVRPEATSVSQATVDVGQTAKSHVLAASPTGSSASHSGGSLRRKNRPTTIELPPPRINMSVEDPSSPQRRLSIRASRSSSVARTKKTKAGIDGGSPS